MAGNGYSRHPQEYFRDRKRKADTAASKKQGYNDTLKSSHAAILDIGKRS
jgi:hypothetical protein